MKSFLHAMLTLALGAALALAAPQAATTPVAKDAPKAVAAKVAKPAKPAAPTAAEIADAKSKGLVWVNLNTKVFHKDGQHYGTTKNGKFMTEADATKAGYHVAKEAAAHTPKTPKPTDTTAKPAAKDKKS